MQEVLTDINSRDDIKSILINFYQVAQEDDVISEKFLDLNMDEHIEVIINFWDSIIFGTNTYQGDPFGKHISMGLEEKHFTRWLKLFTDQIDSQYQGKNADEMKLRGKTIAQIFQHKLG